MAIKIVLSPLVKFKVQGTIKNEAGIDKPFDFWLTCKRLDADEIKAALQDESDKSVIEFLAGVIETWEGVRDDNDKPIDYSEDALKQLALIPGVTVLAFRTYLSEVGAKEKN